MCTSEKEHKCEISQGRPIPKCGSLKTEFYSVRQVFKPLLISRSEWENQRNADIVSGLSSNSGEYSVIFIQSTAKWVVMLSLSSYNLNEMAVHKYDL